MDKLFTYQDDSGHKIPENLTDCSAGSKPRHVAGSIYAGITMRHEELPENGNMALHVCQNPADVAKNRQALSAESLPLSCWALPWQKHTDHFERVSASDRGAGALEADSSILHTDAVYTTDPDVLIGVFTADCLGILVLDPSVPMVCAIHSGWKGTAQNIVHKTITHLLQEDLLHPESTQVYFSPSILKQSFEIGPEVKEQLLNSGKEIGLDYTDLIEDVPGSDRSYADHQTMNLRVLQALGIPQSNLHPGILDTRTNSCCFSYRRDGSKTGEHFSYAYIAPNSEQA